MMVRKLAAAVAALTLAACGKGCAPRTGAQGPIDLAPLPEAPALKIAPDALPGAGGELAVVAARPQGPMKGEVRPTITFSKPVVALGSVEQEKGLPTPIVIEPKVEGEWRWLGSATTEFVPKGLVPYATTFKVTVPKGLRAVDGSALAEEYAFTFETPRPRVQGIQPTASRGKFRWLTPTHTLSITFDQPVKDLAGRLKLEVGGKSWAFAVKETRLADERRETEGGRRFARMGFEERGFKNRQTRYDVTPKSAMPLDTDVQLSLDASLEGAEGPLTVEGGAKVWAFRTYGPFRIEAAKLCDTSRRPVPCPHGPVVLRTTNRVDVKTLAKAITIKPKVEIDWENDASAYMTDETELWIGGPFAAGTYYEISVSPEAKDEFGQALASPFHDGVQTDDVPPTYDVGNTLALIEAKGDGAIPVTGTNVRSVDVRMVPLDPAGLARFLGRLDGEVPDSFYEDGLHAVVDLSAKKNQPRTAPLAVRDLLVGRKTTLFALRTEAPDVPVEERWDRWKRWKRVTGQVTDLAVHAKLGATKGLVWVTRLSDGKPVPGAKLALHDRSGAVRWTGKADQDGLSPVPGLATLLPADAQRYSTVPFALVAAEWEGDVGVTLSEWSGGLEAHAFGLPSDWEGNKPRPLGGVFAERGIYRPGEKVHLKGIARTRKLGQLRTPTSGTVQVKVTSPRGKEVFSQAVPLTGFGTFTAEVPVDADASLGGYHVHAQYSGEGEQVAWYGNFRVEEYRAPQFQVDVTAPAKQLSTGDAVKAQVLARYLFGGAMPGAQVRWTVARESTSFTPPGNAAFSFGSGSWWWDDNAPQTISDVAASGQGETDATGLLAFDAGTAEATGGRTFTYTVEAEVTDVNRQRIANRTALTVHPADAYAGVRRRATGFAEAGKSDVLEVVAAAPDGARKAGVAVDVAVKRREWKWIRKKGPGGTWRVETEVQEEQGAGCKLSTAATPVECAFTPQKPGLYVAEATLADAKGRKQTTRYPFYVTGSGWVSWQREETDRLDLVADKRKYEPGETARILVKSPFPEAEAVLTVEREGVLSSRRVRLTGAATTLEVPVTDEHVPNVFASVVLVRGRVETKDAQAADADPGRPQVRVGYVRLDVEKRSRRLDVTVTPDSAEKRPRDKVTVDVAVKDHAGKPADAEVTVWAVDEGVLRLTAYEAPDPVELIHPPRGLSVRVGESLVHLVERRRYGAKGETAGGGGGGDGSGAGFRSRFLTTVLFAPEVRTDAQGKARVTFELPDNLTTYRIMAVAVTKGDRTGGGQSKIAVAKPLMALPALPRLARSGDRFEAGVVVHAPSGKIREVEVKAEAKGLALEGPEVKRVSLDGNKPREVRFAFRAAAPGEAVLRFAATSGGERDGVEQRIPVRLPVEQEAVATYGDTKDLRREALLPPANVRPDVGGIELTLSSTALAGFSENMRQLVEYPYGCLEQLSSRLVPFIALREIQGKFGLTHEPGQKPAEPPPWARAWLGDEVFRIAETQDPDEVVRRTVKAIEKLQNPDGGYRYWATSDCSAEWASSYAVLALGRAAALGYPVDPESLRRGQAYLSGTVAAGKCTRCGWGCFPPRDPTRAFALYSLARTGAPRASYYGELFSRRKALPLFAQAMLADAMFVGGGDRGDAKKLLGEVMNSAKESAGTVHLEETDALTYAQLWSSDTRTTGIVLATLTDISPDHPHVAKMAAYLARVRKGDGRFRNTQEAAFSLMALAEIARTKEKDVPAFTAKVTLAGKALAEVPFQGRSTDVKVTKLAMSDLPPSKEPLPLDFRRDGSAGVLYYSALMRYAPAEIPKDPLERGIFVQRWIEPYEGGGQVRTVRAGELVRVRVRIGSSQERFYVAASVPIPAGLEIVDTSLATTARRDPVKKAEGPDEGYEAESAEDYADVASDEEGYEDPWGGRFWSPFVFEEKRDDRMVLFADRLPPGMHVASFVARATTPGEFALTPAHAEEMYAPETFGRSDGGTFKVVANETVASR
jgi:uncharacterized protein YfaS (alpha-2-macroglobulin family)